MLRARGRGSAHFGARAHVDDDARIVAAIALGQGPNSPENSQMRRSRGCW
jgi:hypothetical protein